MQAEQEGGQVYTSNVAFSTPSGALHIGHALGYIVASTTSNVENLSKHIEVFTPFGIHSTGKDLYKILEDLKLGANSRKYGINNEEVKFILGGTREEQVDNLVSHYKKLYEHSLMSLGVEVDSQSFFSTHEHAYHTFVNWTLSKLNEKGLIVKTKSYRPFCELCNDIKSIEKDQSEVYTKGNVDWKTVRVDSSGIIGGEFYCRIHKSQLITVKKKQENAINYGNVEYQKRTIDLIKKGLKTFPVKYKQELEEIIKTRREKPIERDARTNIGAPSPFNENAVIEALSDSNIYMEYFAISKAISVGLIKKEHLTNKLYDFLFLNVGNAVALEKELNLQNLSQIKQFVIKYGTIDLNLSGFEHKEVHFPFSLFNHAAILPEIFFPKELILTSHITINGEKMSKSKGNVLYIDDLTNRLCSEGIKGVSNAAALDSIRYFLLAAQPLDKDLDWSDSSFMESGLFRMRKYVSFVHNTMTKKCVDNSNEKLNNWLSTKMYIGLKKGLVLYDVREFRAAIIEGFEKTFNSMTKYMYLNEGNISNVIIDSLKAHLMFAKPVIPRIADELHSKYFNEIIGFFPNPSDFQINTENYDEIEYSLNKDFVKDKLGFLNSRLNQLKGRKLLDKSELVEILVSSDFTKTIIKNILPAQNILNDVYYELIVVENEELGEIAIKYKGVTYR